MVRNFIWDIIQCCRKHHPIPKLGNVLKPCSITHQGTSTFGAFIEADFTKSLPCIAS